MTMHVIEVARLAPAVTGRKKTVYRTTCSCGWTFRGDSMRRTGLCWAMTDRLHGQSSSPVSAGAGVVGVLAEALAKHDGQDENGNVYDDFYDCSCGDWHSDIRSYDERKAAHLVHVASVIAALPDIAIVPIPTEQMTDRSYVADSIQDRPMWLVGDSWSCINEHGVEFETDSQNAYGTVPVDGIADLAAVLLAAARAVGGES